MNNRDGLLNCMGLLSHVGRLKGVKRAKWPLIKAETPWMLLPPTPITGDVTKWWILVATVVDRICTVNVCQKRLFVLIELLRWEARRITQRGTQVLQFANDTRSSQLHLHTRRRLFSNCELLASKHGKHC